MIGMSGYLNNEDRIADARLIWAAPEMLQALIGIQVIAEQHLIDLAADVQEGREPDAVWRMECSRWEAVLAAIAKATLGRTLREQTSD